MVLAPLALLLAAHSEAPVAPVKPLAPLSMKGGSWVDPSGKPVLLRGCNLGNWLMLEMWMLNLSGQISDQHEFLSILEERFGAREAERLMDLYRSSWITERDWKIIPTFGFNVVRLPIDYRLIENESKPKTLRRDAWQWIDHAVNQAEKHGLYVILDMHGVEGGQSPYDHTGHAGQNKLWTSETDQDRLAWLWTQVATRYKGRSAVAAYDLINEPYGGTHEAQIKVFDRLVKAVRAVDPDTVVLVAGHYDGIAHYGDPKDRGWTNTGFTEHFYPGLFGGGPATLGTHARHLRDLAAKADEVRKLDVPYLVGEMNVVFKSAGGASMMRRTYDRHAEFGWATTMWSYKVSSEEGGIGSASWAMVTNKNPVRKIDLRKASKEEIENYMRGFATDELVVYEELRDMLSAKDPVLPPLPEPPPMVRSVPFQDSLPGWLVSDLGGARDGGLRVLPDDRIDVYGGGEDIWGRRDQFRFVYGPLTGDGQIEATVLYMVDTGSYAKAGIMLRGSLQPDSACVLLSTFPNGELQLAQRASDGGEMDGHESVDQSFPMRLRLARRGDLITASVRRGDSWFEIGQVRWPDAPEVLLAGVVALSHDNAQLVRVEYEDMQITEAGS